MQNDKLVQAPYPFAFALVSGSWTPYEFVTNCIAASMGIAAIRGKRSFFVELAHLFKRHEVDDILGFHILHREHLSVTPSRLPVR